ncbi:MAG: 50S ribosomal protein L23 [Alphaproteobacteria bacterium]|nr:50S ribosomal protein L23 [Alphaproteobacteria bacterium]
MSKAKKQTAATARAYHYDVIVSPVVTEKSTRISEQNKVMFNVRLDAGKQDIKTAVEALFGVKVKSVNTLVRLGKQKRFRNTMGKLSDTKKAIITLAEGQSINLEGGVK